MSTIFSRIIRGEIPCHKIAENDRFFAFMDIRPVNPGHTLVIPRRETDYLFDLEDELLGEIMVFAKPIARAIQRVVPCERVGVIVAGLEVPHAHVHLIPFTTMAELNFANARSAPPEQLAELAAKIRAELGEG